MPVEVKDYTKCHELVDHLPFQKLKLLLYRDRIYFRLRWCIISFMYPNDGAFFMAFSRAPCFKLLRSSRIDYKEPIPPGGVCSLHGGPVRQPHSYSVPSTHRLF
jgi:hypothetical protein